MSVIRLDIIHLGDTACVPGLFGIRNSDWPRARQYTPAPLRWGPICGACWLRDEVVRPESSPLCPHGGGAA